MILPQLLLAEIDELVGPRRQSAFLVETARAELKRRRLLEFLSSDEPAWRDEDHPELARGAAAGVRKTRAQEEARHSARLKKAHRKGKQKKQIDDPAAGQYCADRRIAEAHRRVL